jgi:hypothetical protein
MFSVCITKLKLNGIRVLFSSPQKNRWYEEKANLRTYGLGMELWSEEEMDGIERMLGVDGERRMLVDIKNVSIKRMISELSAREPDYLYEPEYWAVMQSLRVACVILCAH